MIKLHSYFRSSAAFRVRIALHLKNLPFEVLGVHLVKEEQKASAYIEKNPQGLVPLMETPSGKIFQSLSMIEYLEECYPNKAPLLPGEPMARAYVRAISQMVACDIHPLNNLRVLAYLKNEFEITDEQKMQWYHHWLQAGFSAIEQVLNHKNYAKNCCFGNEPTMADVCLIPQVYNAYRFECPMDDYPTIKRIWEHCMQLSAFEKASPENQPDRL